MKRVDQPGPFWESFNLGSGNPVSVLEMVKAMGEAVGKEVPYEIGERRAGDLPKFWADPDKAAQLLNWRTKKTLSEMSTSFFWGSEKMLRASDVEKRIISF